MSKKGMAMHKFPTQEVLHTLSLILTIALMSCDFGPYETCSDSSSKDSLTWSPDGTKIAFRSDGRVHVMNADGTGRIDLTEDWEMDWSSADMSHSWSPDGTEIAFNYPRLDGSDVWTEIYISNVDGTDLFNLTNSAGSDDYPAWSPDGTKIAFKSSRYDASGHYTTGIYVMNTDGTDQVYLASQGPVVSSHSWSPDGTKIAFSRDGINTINADGTDQLNLTASLDVSWFGGSADPSWSPDGTKIAFRAAWRDGMQLYVVNADGTGDAKHLTTGVYSYSWSPDGTKIVFDGINTIDADGSGNAKHLIDGYAPSWSPDGTKIAFLRGCGFEQDSVWVMNADGTNERLLAK